MWPVVINHRLFYVIIKPQEVDMSSELMEHVNRVLPLIVKEAGVNMPDYQDLNEERLHAEWNAPSHRKMGWCVTIQWLTSGECILYAYCDSLGSDMEIEMSWSKDDSYVQTFSNTLKVMLA